MHYKSIVSSITSTYKLCKAVTVFIISVGSGGKYYYYTVLINGVKMGMLVNKYMLSK